MRNVLFVMFVFCAPTIAEAQQPLPEASALVCGAEEIQVCTESNDSGGYNVMYHLGSPLLDCSVASERGVALRCVAREFVCDTSKALCERQSSDRWQWNENSCRCDYHRPTPAPPTPPPAQPAPSCTDCNVVITCEEGRLESIRDGLTAIEDRLDQLEILVLELEDIRELRAEAENLREAANECRDDVIAERATILIAALDPETFDYHDEFDQVHQHLDDLDFTVEEETGCDVWCAIGIAAGTLAAGAAIFLGVYYGTEWSATQE
jgi:hypothetical protein